MKELKAILKQLLNGVLLGALTIPLILYVISATPSKPTLSFESNRIVMHTDGSIQLLFDVCVSGLDYTDGVQFTLNYNSEYITPSYYKDCTDEDGIDRKANEPLLDPNDEEALVASSHGAFQYAPDLYKDASGQSVNPFDWDNEGAYGDYVFAGIDSIPLYLFIDQTLEVDATANADTAMTRLYPVGEKVKTESVFKVDSGKLKLGTLSFRVVNDANIVEIIERFNGQNNLLLEQNHAKGVNDNVATEQDRLIYFANRAGGAGEDLWKIGIYPWRTSSNDYDHQYIDDRNNDENAQALFSYNFPKTIIAARAANPELHLNAYQVYTAANNDTTGAVVSGTLDDIDATLQRYSPAVTVTYSDGTEGNFVMPWSRENNGWSATVVTDVAASATLTDTSYDPTASYTGEPNATAQGKEHQYTIQKTFRYGVQTDITNGTTTIVKTETTPTATTTVDIVDFPIPVTVDLYVMPVVLESVTAEGLKRSYELNNVVSGENEIKGFDDLELPTQARLVTDIPVANGTLTMGIDGWSHAQTDLSGGTTYWNNTDMDKLLKDGATSADEHWATSDDTLDGNGWNYTEGSSTRGANRAGVYTFTMTTKNGNGTADSFTKTELTEAYPWLTVNDADYKLDGTNVATRTIVWNEQEVVKLVEASSYNVAHQSTTTNTITITDTSITTYDNQQPTMNLTVKKENGSLPANSTFTVKMPDGTVIESAWFVAENGKMSTSQNTSVTNHYYTISINPGDTTVGSYKTEREKLRRYINQGGWFYVSVKEAEGTSDETRWSDDIPVYVSPRENKYEESKIYNFFGKNGGLYPWAGGISSTITLPQGQYNELTDNGSGDYTWTADGTTVTGYKQANYGIKTTYNGNTGEQGDTARIYTFQTAQMWTSTSNSPITNVTTYNKNNLLDHSLNAYYGWLENEMNGASYDSNAKSAEIRVESTEPAKTDEKLELRYVSSTGSDTVEYYDALKTEVKKVTFDNREEGYTLRQTFTLELVNTGSVDIEGLHVDMLTDLAGNSAYDKGEDSDPAGGHFEILQQPAAFLPAGAKTTFVLTYVYNLKANKEADTTLLDYLDKIYITSNSKNNINGTRGTDYLWDFDAEFKVADDGLHKVTINVVPTDTNGTPLMGDAWVIVGSADEDRGSTTFSKDSTVYILTDPYDEYTLKSIDAVDSLGNPVSITLNSDPDIHGHGIYSFTMPDADVTVTVTFEESVYSKLRLSDLRVYSDGSLGNLCETTHDSSANGTGNTNWATDKVNYEQTIWQKKFPTDTENTLAANTVYNLSYEAARLALMTSLDGVADQPGYKESSWSQYLVVIPYEDDYSQVEVDLREVLYTAFGNTDLNPVTVEMLWYPTLADVTADNTTTIYDSALTGTTNPKTTHTSDRFTSPAYGTSSYVKVTTGYADSSSGTTVTTYRSFYIELHRAPEKVEAELNYGNSPYGMIMNDDIMSTAAKENAKIAFVENNYTFEGLISTLIPSVVKTNGLESIHYWIEAWTVPTEMWKDPNADWTNDYYTTGAGVVLGKTGNDAISVYDDETGMSKELYLKLSNKAEVTTTATDGTTTTVLTAVGTENSVNLDLNSYSFFAIMGKEFTDAGLKSAKDSSGREVAPTDIVITLEKVDTLDTTANANTSADQVARFTTTGTIKIALKQADGTAATSGTTVAQTWAATDDAGNTVELRPGQYKLTYTFEDYNHTAADPHYLVVERDFVILAPVGDVNADGHSASTDDVSLIEKRYSDSDDAAGHAYPALGYMAYSDNSIFKLRTVDANNDRNINNADANTIKKGTAVQTFYLPTDYKTAGTSSTPSTP